MCEKRCKTCGFWKGIGELWPDSPIYGQCSADFYFVCKQFEPFSDFGCIHWLQREPDLREQLAEYVHELVLLYEESGRHKWREDRSLGVADEIITLFFKKYQKGNGNG